MQPLIILDRDGVINYESNLYIKSPDEWIPLPRSLEAIASLHQAGFVIVVATNQSGIARGLYDHEMLNAIHHKMCDSIKAQGVHIDRIFFCPHHPDEQCDCRKPAPGLLHQIAAYYQCNLDHIPFVGDNWRDILAARAVNAQPVLVKTGCGLETLENHAHEIADILVKDDLWEVAQYYINQKD